MISIDSTYLTSNNNNNINNNSGKKKNKNKKSHKKTLNQSTPQPEAIMDSEDIETIEVEKQITDKRSRQCNKQSNHIENQKQQSHNRDNDRHNVIDNEEIEEEEEEEEADQTDCKKSFLLIDENEFMQIESVQEFADKLGCQSDTLVKVVSIFGSIGHGKSYTLNHTFYDCQGVFQTSSSQDSCTIGVWAAYDEKRRVITLDTEGLLGVSANCQRRTRLLLKVLAISDIVIYRTRSERLEDNIFTFLGDASRVYRQHFFKELRSAFHRLPELNGQPFSELGPVVIIFQETRDTEPLRQDPNQTRENIIRSRFKTLGLSTEAFSAIEYVGVQTLVRPTNFDQLKVCIKRHIKNSFSRTPRSLLVIYTTLRLLNEKFNGDIEKTVPSMFPNQYLTCPTTCLSCNARCTNSMNHNRDGLGHTTDTKCIYQHQFNNHTLFCRACYERGEEVAVNPKTCSSDESPIVGIAKYAWSGYVLECPRCGVIHRSRQYWFGNKDVWESVVRTEIRHVWPGELNKMQAAQNAAQRVLDSVNYLTEAVTTISARPTKAVSEWVADQIAPNYWIPNSRILNCALCNNEFGQFDQKHHCRLCGNGLCSTCSSKSKPVPERGWGETSVRVCDLCYERSDNLSAISSLPPLPPMLAQAQQQATPNGVFNNHHNQTNNIISQNNSNHQTGNQKHSPVSSRGPKNITPSSSIPIPANRGCVTGGPSVESSSSGVVGANSVGNTPTPFSSSSVGSSSSGSNHSVQLINDYHKHQRNNSADGSTDSGSGGSPNKKNGLMDGDMADAVAKNGRLLEGQQKLQTQTAMEFITDLQAPSATNKYNPPNQATSSTASSLSQMMNGDTSATITARKLGEVLQNTLKSVVSTAIVYPMDVIKDSARPDYWLPDSQITCCGLCKTDFNEKVTIHHCRRCGGGFCNDCSAKSMPVPERGWGDVSVRVCDKCYDTR